MAEKREPATEPHPSLEGPPYGGQTVAEALADMDWSGLCNNVDLFTPPLCLIPKVSATHDGESFSLALSLDPGPTNTTALLWTATPSFPQPTSATLDYGSSSYDSAEDALHLSSINSTLSYSLTGSITAGDATLTTVLRAVLFIEANLHFAGEDASSASANIVDVTWTVTYGVDWAGVELFVVSVADQSVDDRSQQFGFSGLNLTGLSQADLEGLCTQARDAAETLATGLGNSLTLSMSL